MNDNHVYSIQSYENQISHNYYSQIVIHEICEDGININLTHKIEIKNELKKIRAKNISY
jgi:hypothetical protein